MKKLFALFITLLLFSCSPEEDGNKSDDPLIGVWEGTVAYEFDEPDEYGVIGLYYDYTFTVNTELIKLEIRDYVASISTAPMSSYNETTNDGLCTSNYEVTEYTWENTGDDFTRQQQTYSFLGYSECGEVYTYENEEEKEEYTTQGTFIFNSDFTEFYDPEELADYEDRTIFYKVWD